VLVQILLEDNNLSIVFKEEIKSLIKIQLVTIYGLEKKNESKNIYEKSFTLDEALEINEYLKTNNYEIFISKNLSNIFFKHYEKQNKTIYIHSIHILPMEEDCVKIPIHSCY